MFENQRKIEFKVWDRREKIFITEGVTISLDGTVNLPGAGRYVLSQYTGYKDNACSKKFPEGRKLFENDIVKHTVRKKTGVIQYHRNFAGFYVYLPDEITDLLNNKKNDLQPISRYWKKTGNCFENSELLKKTESSLPHLILG